MVPSDLFSAYQWNYRPQIPRRPDWFTQWPGGNRIAVTINIMHEWESAPGARTVRKRPMTTDGDRTDFLTLGAREYGANFGFRRLLEVLDRCGVKGTVLTSGLMAELFPETLKEGKQRGHEVACHHWDQSVHPYEYKTREEEREAILKAVAAIERATGERPLGYMSPGPRPSPYTLDVCASLGFRWNGDYCDSDVPYIIDVNGNKDDFAVHYEEAGRHPMKFRCAVHNFNGGRPGLAKVFENFLAYVKGHPGVWFCRCIDIAQYWLEQAGA